MIDYSQMVRYVINPNGFINRMHALKKTNERL